jgi:DNA polymerase III delta prime subunit
MQFDEFIGRLHRVKRCGTGVSAKCPSHLDEQNSLSATPESDRILVNCHRSCTAEQIVAAMDLTLADLFYERRNGHAHQGGGRAGLTLAEFATAKGFTAKFLADHGVAEEKGALVFHYLLMNGQRAARQRIRLALDKAGAAKKFIWNKAEGRPVPYGLWLLDGAHKRGAEDLFLVEGESDALTLWLHGYVAIGIPGSDMAKTLQAPHVKEFRRVFIVRENDVPKAGDDKPLGCETFEKGCVGRLAELEFSGSVAVVEIEKAAVKDTNDLHVKFLDDAGGFKSEFDALIGQARPVELPIVGLEIFDASTVNQRKLDWLWPGRIPLGKLVLFVGPPGLGKSFAALDIAARLTNSAQWPDGAPNGRTVKSLIFSAEDGIEDTIIPRLIAQGAVRRQIMLARRLREANEAGEIVRRGFNLAKDLPHIERALDRNPDTRLIVIDPVSAYLGRVDSHKNAELRSDVLDPLAELAERRNVTVLAITHFNKGAGSNSLERISGSIAFPAAARQVWGFARDPDDPARRLMLFGKTNVGKEMPGLAFRVVENEEGLAELQWIRGDVEAKLDDVLREEQEQGRDQRRDKRKLDAAKELIHELCGGREVLVSELERCASERGISERTLNKARFEMGVQWRREGFGKDGKIYVILPEGNG